ncbi:MAG: nucleoside monophosphate kinase [Spirochaetota bacterium]
MILFIYGLPGSGKGTQSELIKEKYGFNHISTGDIIRDVINNKKEGWEKLNEYVSSGQLVPDEMINDLFFNSLNEKGIDKNYIIDGYPRNINQLELISEKLKNFPSIDVMHLYIKCDEDKIIKRITSRRICESCGAIFNIELDKDIQNCKFCGAKLYQRVDDQYSVIKKRIDEYKIKTLPVINRLKENNLLYEVNGDRDIDSIFNEIIILLKGKVG